MNDRAIEKFLVELRKQQRNLKLVKPDGMVLQNGLHVSKQALSMPEVVALTPYGKNMYEQLDNKKGKRLLAGDKVTKAEAYIEAQTRQLLNKYCGKERYEYDRTGSPSSYDNYQVDCWRNFKTGDSIRHVKPHMNEERLENFKKFSKPIKDVDIIGYLKDPLFMKAVDFIMELIPEVTSSNKWQEVNLPFMTKHSNVGYPYYRNDQSVDPKTGLTYAQITDKQARKMKPKDVAGYPFVAFGRNLRQKPRPILGGSRLQALVFNQLESAEIQTYKQKSPLFIAYNDDTIMKEKMVKLGEWLEKHPDIICENRDYVQYDTTVPPSLRALASAIRYIKTTDKRGKEIAFWRAVSQNKAYLVNGLDNSLRLILARIFSGEIDTNAGGGLTHAIVDVYSILQQFPNWIEEVAKPILQSGSSPLWVMGDDNLLSHPRSINETKYQKDVHKFNLDVSRDKGEFGLFFAQRRTYKGSDGKWYYITPFTRVIRQLFSKENKKGLGPAGWTVATYMNLALLIERPDIMVDVAKIFYPFDEYKLGINWTVKQLKQLIAKEDKESRAEHGPRSLSTAERLFDGDPLKAQFFSDNGKSLNLGPIEKIHDILSKALR